MVKFKRFLRFVTASPTWLLGGRTSVQAIRIALVSALFLGCPLTALAQQYASRTGLRGNRDVTH